MDHSEFIFFAVFGIIAGIIVAGFLAGYSAVAVLNRMPASWLTDYGEEPDGELLGERLSPRPYAMILSLVFVLLFTGLVLQFDGLTYAIIGMPVLWLLMMIGIADHKYSIIPDQLVAALAIISAAMAAVDLYSAGDGGIAPYFHTTWYSPVAGALIGGGSLLLIGMIGSKISGQEAMGFGDVKLLAAAGLLCGIRGILIVLILSVLISGLWFILLLIGKKIRRGDHKPLGPYIAASCGIYLVFYEQVNYLVDLYLSLY